MKTMKLVSVSLLALACAGIASAQTLVKVTGSTAFRKATYFAIIDSLNSPKAAAIGGDTTNNDMSGAARAIIRGTLKSGPSAGVDVAYQLAWGGSVGGVQVVTQNLSTIPGTSFTSAQTWLSATNTLTPVSITGGKIQGWTEGAAAFDAASTADATNSDSFQSSTPFKSPVLVEENAAGGGVGVVQFLWVKGRKHPDFSNSTSYEGLTNVTALQAQLLLAAGELPLSLFTGNASDIAYDVVLVGRNNDSGTRLDAEAEPGFGFGFGVENQYQPVISAGSITGISNVGDVGYASGGNVATALKTPIASGARDDAGNIFVFVGYVGKGDAGTAITGGAQALAYNGSTYYNNSTATYNDAAIQNGAYTFWAYEHAYYRSSLTGVKKNALDLMSNTLRGGSLAVNGEPSQSGIVLTSMGVNRGIEGGVVAPQ